MTTHLALIFLELTAPPILLFLASEISNQRCGKRLRYPVLVTQEDIQRVIDKAHMRVYGEERLARKERLKPLEDESGEPDWDAFDSPTFERRGGN